jgi:phage terminase small subunit
VATPRNPEVPPRDLDPESKELWKSTIEALTAQGTWQTSDVPLLQRYVTSLRIARAADRRITAREEAMGDDAFVCEGSHKQLVSHPDLRVLREAQRDASGFATELLLSPRTRSQHGIKALPGRGRLAEIFGPNWPPPVEGVNRADPTARGTTHE